MLLRLRRSIVASLIFLVLCGIVFALAGTGLSHLLFHPQANRSLTLRGSPLIGQPWIGRRWLQGRPDATVCTPAPGALSSLAPTSPADARPRGRVAATGIIRSTTEVALGGCTSLYCVLGDGTGEIGLLFIGRPSIAELVEGAGCTGEGAARMETHRPVLWNLPSPPRATR